MVEGGSRRTYSVDEFCEIYGIGRPKALSLIASGQLIAVNVALNLDGRPRWRIPEWAIDEWEKSRLSTLAPKPKRRPKRAAPNITEFY